MFRVQSTQVRLKRLFQLRRPARQVIATLLLASPLATSAQSTNFSLRLQVAGANAQLRWPSQAGEQFRVERTASLSMPATWQVLGSHVNAGPGLETTFTHTNALQSGQGFYRVARLPFTFEWSGTNFTYTDGQRAFTGVMLKPTGNGPFPGVIISHGAGGTASGYSLTKAREMLGWGVVCIGPTLTHVAGGETNAPNMGNCPENQARAVACANVLASLPFVDTNRLALFGHSMGAFATIGDAAVLGGRIRAAAITSGGIIPDVAGTNNAAPTETEASPVATPFRMFHCDADPVVPPVRSQLLQQLLTANSVPHSRTLYPSNSIPNPNNWHNIHQDAAVNADVLTNTFQWFKAHGVL